MNLLQRYSLSMGSKIDKSTSIQTKFFPISAEKYITFNAASTNMPAKNYFYWQEVINLIGPKLQEQGVSIVQLGAPEEPQFGGVIRINGQTSIQQSAHLIKNSLLHLGVDSMLIHIASQFNVPIVGLYSVSAPNNCGPAFGDKEKQILLEPNFQPGETYSYNPQQNPAPVNSIKIEDIVESVGKLLSLDFPKIVTKHIGSNFFANIVEILPDGNIAGPQFIPGAIPTIRLDLGGAPEAAFQQIAARKSALYTKTHVDVNILIQLKQNIERVIFEITKDNFDLDFIKKLYHSGIPFILLTELTDEEIAMNRLDVADFGIIHNKPKGKRPENLEVNENTYFRTNKFFFAGGKTFISIDHWRKNQPLTENSNISKLIESDQFYSENADFVIIFDKIN